MKIRILNAAYWFIALLIGFGAFGHAFIGVRPVRDALAAVTLPTPIREAIWIVWAFVSGAMIVFAILIIGAWFVARRQAAALAVPIVIGGFYVIYGIAAFSYQRDPFWLVFLVEGSALLALTIGLRAAVRQTGT